MSSETKWTKGEWQVANRGCEGFAVIRLGSVISVASFMSESDAQLLVGAPKLYEALAAQLKWFEAHHAILLELGNPDFVAMRDQARAALASARGES